MGKYRFRLPGKKKDGERGEELPFGGVLPEKGEKKRRMILTGCCFAASLFAALMVMCGYTVLNDWYWHSEIGRYIAETGRIPDTGILAWYTDAHGTPWTAHEWLSELIFWDVCGSSEKAAVIFGRVLGAVFALAVSAVLAKKSGTHPALTSLAGLVLLGCSAPFCYARPQTFSFIMFAAACAGADFMYRKKPGAASAGAYAVFSFVLAVLWANLHGGSSNLAYAVPAMYAVSCLPGRSFGKITAYGKYGRKSAVPYLVSAAASAAGICINPYGFRMLVYPYSNMKDSDMLSSITEWAPPDIKTDLGLLMYAACAGIIIIYVMTEKKIRAKDLLPVLFGVYLFCRSPRFFPFLAAAAAFAVPDYLPDAPAAAGTDDGTGKPVSIYRTKFGFTGALSFAAVTAATLAVLTVQTYMNTGTAAEDREITPAFAEAIKTSGYTHPYSHFNLGGELIHNGIEPFIDGRADMYTASGIFRDWKYLAVSSTSYGGDAETEKLVKKYGFDSFICLKAEPLNGWLAASGKYKVLASDSGCVYWVPSD